MQHCIKILLFLILNEAQRVSGDTPPIIRSLKTAQAASGFAYMEGCRTCSCVQQLHVRQPSIYAKPEAACAVLGS